ncbi:Kinesin-like protein NACK1 [Capsicum baccatum]|uniref:Kinesin-like protein NACK1 n=1 Tax=Capsicum baccatum TaxID=33114 RepID=A0A2G2X599_CAPBA|nr:Kinesin-like protein NACK1 [Capsicum baccatum]
MSPQVAPIAQPDAFVCGNSFACVSQSSTLGSWVMDSSLIILLVNILLVAIRYISLFGQMTKDLGRLKYFLGTEVAQSRSGQGQLSDPGRYRRLVEKLNYITVTRLDLTYLFLTKYRAMAVATCELVWITQLLRELKFGEFGSESSKAETTGVRRKEGSYINKSLLTLGTVISKLTDGKATHIPYRDSKLTRLLQSSLSGQGRVSLICTVTPSSSNSEETHNTLKFAHRAKHIEIQAAQNKIIDEKSLIKKYQNEIRRLREELEQLRRGIVAVPQMKDSGEDFVLLKQKLEDGQVRLQSRLEQEEEAKAALLGRIQRLTKLILVSTKTSQSSRFPHRAGPRRRHSFGEEEVLLLLAYLPHRRRDLILEDENVDLYVSVDGNMDISDNTFKEEKKTRKNGLLNWFKPRRRDSGSGTLASTSDRSSGIKSTSTPSTPLAENHMESSNSRSIPTESTPSAERLSDVILDKEVPEDNLLDPETSMTSMKTIDQIDLLREQQKIFSGEVALHTSALKRLSEEATPSPKKEQVQMEIRTLKDEIRMKNEQIASLEKQIAESITSPCDRMENQEEIVSVAELLAQLNEKSFELEVRAADNRIIQDQLNQKTHECENLQEAIVSFKQQLSDALDKRAHSPSVAHSLRSSETKSLLVELIAEKESGALKDAKEALFLQAQQWIFLSIFGLKIFKATGELWRLAGNRGNIIKESLEGKASLWVQSNVLKLSRLFGAAFEGLVWETLYPRSFSSLAMEGFDAKDKQIRIIRMFLIVFEVVSGMPLGNNHKELVIWDDIIEKTEKLANCKTQYLSLGGRTILINSVLDSLPTYVMSLFPMPTKVEERLDKLRRYFLWLGNKEGKGIHLVKWQTALLSRSFRGYGDQKLGVTKQVFVDKMAVEIWKRGSSALEGSYLYQIWTG